MKKIIISIDIVPLRGKLRNLRYVIGYSAVEKISHNLLRFTRNIVFIYIVLNLLLIIVSVAINKALRKLASRKSVKIKKLYTAQKRPMLILCS